MPHLPASWLRTVTVTQAREPEDLATDTRKALLEASETRQALRDKERLREIAERQAQADAELAARFAEPRDGREDRPASTGYMSLEAVAAEFGVSRQAIQQIEAKALKKLRRYAAWHPELQDWLASKVGSDDCRVECQPAYWEDDRPSAERKRRAR